jgi:hypothetical protein
VVPSGTNSKWMTPMMSKKQINIILILDFDIRGFFGLGIHHELFLRSLTFHLAIYELNTKIQIHYLVHRTLNFHI